MRHEFMEEISSRLARRAIATLRYQFPYMEAGRKRPDQPHILEATARRAIEAAREAVDLPLIAGGKSMGGRITSQAMARDRHPDVRGLAFLGFPLHAAKKPSPSMTRGVHLGTIDLPMLFVQGTRDPLADLELMGALCTSLGRRATLHVVQGGDHSFKVLKQSQRTYDQVLDEIADALASWGESVIDSRTAR